MRLRECVRCDAEPWDGWEVPLRPPRASMGGSYFLFYCRDHGPYPDKIRSTWRKVSHAELEAMRVMAL